VPSIVFLDGVHCSLAKGVIVLTVVPDSLVVALAERWGSRAASLVASTHHWSSPGHGLRASSKDVFASLIGQLGSVSESVDSLAVDSCSGQHRHLLYILLKFRPRVRATILGAWAISRKSSSRLPEGHNLSLRE